MRKMILMLALASVAVPAMAEPQNGWADRRAARAERAVEAPRAEAPREVRASGEARGNWQRSQVAPVAQAPQAPQAERGMRSGWNGGFARGNAGAQAVTQAPDPAQAGRWRQRQEQNRAQQAGDGTVPATRWSDHVRQAPTGGWNQQQLQGQAAPVGRYGNRTGDQRQWQGTQQARQGNGDRSGQRWSNNWRRDSRYDWQRYRNSNRSIFRLGSYYDPFGWGYQPLSIGFMLNAGYYQSNYWLDDPWQYRLPPAYGPYRWVRYYDDAVLVDIYSGQVVDVIQGFFW